MPHTRLLVATHMAHHWHGVTHVAALGVLWVGALNVAMLLVFLVVASRPPTRRQGRPPACEHCGCPHHEQAREPASFVADLDRDRAIEVICAAVGDGRLSFDEGSARVEQALVSRTAGEIAIALRGLPAPCEPQVRRTGPSASASVAVAAAAVLVVLAASLVQLAAGSWLAWPVAVATLLSMALRHPRSAGRTNRGERLLR